jgi:hypothetical protein
MPDNGTDLRNARQRDRPSERCRSRLARIRFADNETDLLSVADNGTDLLSVLSVADNGTDLLSVAAVDWRASEGQCRQQNLR